MVEIGTNAVLHLVVLSYNFDSEFTPLLLLKLLSTVSKGKHGQLLTNIWSAILRFGLFIFFANCDVICTTFITKTNANWRFE